MLTIDGCGVNAAYGFDSGDGHGVGYHHLSNNLCDGHGDGGHFLGDQGMAMAITVGLLAAETAGDVVNSAELMAVAVAMVMRA